MSYSKQFILSAMLAGALCTSPVSLAQETTETALNVEITGLATHFSGFPPFEMSEEAVPVDFVIKVRQDVENRTELGSSGMAVGFADVGLTIEFELLDDSGEAFYTDSHTTLYPRSNECAGGAPPVMYIDELPFDWENTESATTDGVRVCVETEDFSSIFKLIEVYVGAYSPWYFGPFSEVEDDLFTNGPVSSVYQLNTDGYPEFVLGETVQAIDLYSWQYDLTDIFDWEAEPDPDLAIDFGFSGYITSIQALINDADEDGIADEVDQCSASLLDETVSFDGIDSGVANVVDANGCSVMDHYAACEADQQSSGFLGYSGASYCEQQVAYQLYREGLIDYADVRALRNALN